MFTLPVVQTIWDEVEAAHGHGDYVGIAVEDPCSVRETVWVWYACRSGSFMGQEQKYPAAVWDDLSLAFQLLDRLCASAGYPDMVRQYRDPRWSQPDRVRLVLMFVGRDSHPDGVRFIARCLQRVDCVMQELSESVS